MFLSVGLLPSAAMKFTLIAAVVVLALAQGQTITHDFFCQSANIYSLPNASRSLTPSLPLKTQRKLCPRCCRSGKARSVLRGLEEQNHSGGDGADPEPGPGQPGSVSTVNPWYHNLHTQGQGLVVTHCFRWLHLPAARHTGPCPMLNASCSSTFTQVQYWGICTLSWNHFQKIIITDLIN